MPKKAKRTKPNPHDEYAKSIYQELPHAAGLFQGYLPRRMSDELDWSTLRLEREAFITDGLSSEFADLLFSVRFKNSKVRQRLRLLFEHKRRPIKGMLRQIQRYINRQFERTPINEPLPCVITILLLQSGQCDSSSLSSEYKLPDNVLDAFRPFFIDFHVLPIELSRLNESQLKGTEVGRLALAMLKSVGAGRPMDWLNYRGIIRTLCRKLEPENLTRELQRSFYYLTSVVEPEQEQEVRQALLDAKAEFEPVEESVVTLLEHLEKRGEERGRAKGLSDWLSVAMPEFTADDANRLNKVSLRRLDQISAAMRARESWDVIRELIWKR